MFPDLYSPTFYLSLDTGGTSAKDNQEMSYQCPVVKSEVDITGNIEDIYKEVIKPETAETLEKILEFRKLRKED